MTHVYHLSPIMREEKYASANEVVAWLETKP
jgi:hypothetical protein